MQSNALTDLKFGINHLQFRSKRDLVECLTTTEPPGSAAAESSRRWRQRDRPILAYGLMLVVAVSLVLNYFIKFPTFPDEAAASFRQYCDKRLPLQIETSDAADAWNATLRLKGSPFAVRTLDPATYTLKGGRAQRVLNRKSSWCAYQGAAQYPVRLPNASGQSGGIACRRGDSLGSRAQLSHLRAARSNGCILAGEKHLLRVDLGCICRRNNSACPSQCEGLSGTRVGTTVCQCSDFATHAIISCSRSADQALGGLGPLRISFIACRKKPG